MREIFVTELVRDVLGPRYGMYERLKKSNNPLSEYITGVLAPWTEQPARDIDAVSDLPAGGYPEEAEDDTTDVDVLPPPLLSPALDPQSRPHSIGISFSVEAESYPRIEVCLTWARYLLDQQTDQWCRKPRFSIQKIDCECEPQVWIDESGNVCQANKAEISLHVRCRKQSDRRFLITCYLVNRLSAPQASGDGKETERYIFQPQIRVKCLRGTQVVPGVVGSVADGEERRLQFLYRNHPVLARGHLCSAVWESIDPERKTDGFNLDDEEARNLPPFCWVDGELLEPDTRQRFSPPDVRTEFVPIYSVQAPLLEWREQYGPRPELRADEIAEMWDPGSIEKGLQPLVDGYRKWIRDLRDNMKDLRADQQEISQSLIRECERVAERIQRGINLLKDDKEVRLSFCFAMKAMAIQATWPKGSSRPPLRWHPFQLAFILMCLESLANPSSPDRDVCDLLWVPTGAGKTEAYLALAAFAMAYRRRRALKQTKGDRTGAGVAVISRYTLRLLTIQQFRRTLKMVTACEWLRIEGFSKGQAEGWRPKTCDITERFIWGSSRFSVGLWVGGGVTPNHLLETWGGNKEIPGALDTLKGGNGEGEPAQVLNCPACNSLLAFSELPAGQHTLFYVVYVGKGSSIPQSLPGTGSIAGATCQASTLPSGFHTLEVHISCNGTVSSKDIDTWWDNHVAKQTGVRKAFARASRPGYFIRHYNGKNGPVDCDFDICCPNPECPLHQPWTEGTPLGELHQTTGTLLEFPDGNRSVFAPEPFRHRQRSWISDRIPIPAYTVDDQIYHRCPSIVVATVDKFARMAFEPRASALFGHVRYYHGVWGYYRQYAHPSHQDQQGHPGPVGNKNSRNYVCIPPLHPPDLILQDELHLIEGPLGSLVGIYETAVDFLCRERVNYVPKYVASTATVRRAEEQVQSLFNRRLLTFPAPGTSVDDSFFIHFQQVHPLDDGASGRLYVGVCAPGRGPLTPLVRIWARLLHTAHMHQKHPCIDPFWTLTGYFNAIRELAGARALYRQDIPQRLQDIVSMQGHGNARQLDDQRCQELSSRTNSIDLPAVLESLNSIYPDAPDALLTTSMFGTGVDIPRLGLMVVHGQPKTTSAYIQSTGRVGRRRGALVVTFLRATRPRDLNHYEFFCGYHAQLHRFVEPISVTPFAPGVIQRVGGPVAVAILRNKTRVTWYPDSKAGQMHRQRSSPDVVGVPQTLEQRAMSQPATRCPNPSYVQQQIEALLDRWQQIAAKTQQQLRFVEYAISGTPTHHVVLGDPQHQYQRHLQVVYENAPQSLRDIEETCGFEV
jgi:hypothetical protein